MEAISSQLKAHLTEFEPVEGDFWPVEGHFEPFECHFEPVEGDFGQLKANVGLNPRVYYRGCSSPTTTGRGGNKGGQAARRPGIGAFFEPPGGGVSWPLCLARWAP